MAKLKKGIIMSVEALLAALVLFGMFLIMSTLISLQHDYQKYYPLLHSYSQDILLTGQKSGAFLQVIETENDSLIRNMADSLPPSVCAQIEIYGNVTGPPYGNATTPTNMYYSYTSQNCTADYLTPKAVSYRTFALHRNSTLNSYYWIKAISYPRG
ncbi:MAG: hypothetical protein ABIH83_04305 [Candidatus Micrarchaeota archaeon]